MYITYNIVKGNKYYHYEEKERVNGILKRTYFEYIGRMNESQLKEQLKTHVLVKTEVKKMDESKPGKENKMQLLLLKGEYDRINAFLENKKTLTDSEKETLILMANNLEGLGKGVKDFNFNKKEFLKEYGINESKPITSNKVTSDFKESQQKAHLERIASGEKVSILERELRSALEKGSNTATKRKHIDAVKRRLEKAREIDNRIQDNYTKEYLMPSRYTHTMEKVAPRMGTNLLYIEIGDKGDHINVKDESNGKVYEGNWTGSRYIVNFNAPDGFNSRLYYNL